jgi:hypothetical protein
MVRRKSTPMIEDLTLANLFRKESGVAGEAGSR